jgi:hypothetical protein
MMDAVQSSDDHPPRVESDNTLDPSDLEHDPNRDPMGPPPVPCECYCLHCQRTFMSNGMWFQRVVGDPDGFDGFWMCPTPNCSGSGYQFDIFPTDPDHPDNEGWSNDDGEDGEDDEDFNIEAELDEADEADVTEALTEYDPAEPEYKKLDENQGEGDDDLIEGDEWKLGLAPGESVPPQMYWPEAQRRAWEEEQKEYDGPDLRPRELDWSGHESRRKVDGNDPNGEQFKEDDIPF